MIYGGRLDEGIDALAKDLDNLSVSNQDRLAATNAKLRKYMIDPSETGSHLFTALNF